MGVALLKFRDGLNTGANGVAFITTFLQDLIIENATSGSGAGIGSWRITLLQAPPGSARQRRPFIDPLSGWVIAESANGDTPSGILYSLESGFYGCYRIMLEVWSLQNYGGDRDYDIRNAGIPLPNKKIIIPPYQKDPDPIELSPGSKPDEMNFESQTWGWAGPQYSVGDYPWRLLNEALVYLDSITSSSGTPQLHYVLATENQTVFPLPDTPQNGVVLMVVNGIIQRPTDFVVVADVVNYTGVALLGGASVAFYYWLGDDGGGGTTSVVYSAHAFLQGVSGVASVEVDTFTDVGAILFDPEKYEGTWKFQSVVEATLGHTAEIRLYDVTNDVVVYGTTLNTTSNVPAELSADIILGAGSRVYVVQLRLSVGTGGAATCKMAGIEVTGRGVDALTAPQLTGDETSYNPAGWDDATWVELSSDASRTISGMVASSTMKKLLNTGANPILFTHQDAGAAAAERTITPDGLTFTLAAGGVAYVRYDSTATRWTIV